MERIKKICLVLLGIVLILSGCASTSKGTEQKAGKEEIVTEVTETEEATRVVTDVYGREVEIPNKVESIICTGNGALRMVSYLKATDMLIGIEENDMIYETNTKRDYAHAYYDLFSTLPAIGKGTGSAYSAYPEEIIKLNSDVIITAYTPEAADQLTSETGIPVICVNYRSINFIDESFYKAVKLIGDVLGKEERATEVLSFIDAKKADLNVRTKDISEESKPKVYTGAVTFSGAHGFAGTYANFGPFMAINANNVADVIEEQGYFDVDLEKVIEWDPDIIFLDPGNMNLVNEEYKENPNFFNSLRAVEEDNIYTMPSFNNYSTNVTYALMDAYYTGTVLYPEEFSDIKIEETSNEILSFFLMKGYYKDMVEDGMGFGKLRIGE